MASAESDTQTAGPSRNRVVTIAAVVVAAVVVWKLVLAPTPSSGAGASPAAAPADAAEEAPEEGEVVPIPELVLNLADRDDLRYLRVGLALVLEKGTSADAVADELPKASDVAIEYLSSKTFEELHDPELRRRAKEELSALVREAFGGEKVVRVIFTSFVMQ